MRAEPIFIALDEGAAYLLDRLHAAGHAAYAVGGCVRDSLLGLIPHDWDLCTSATPAEVLALFGEEHCIPTGLQHGTVTIKSHGNLYETTTFRTEGAYSDGRHPDAVHFVPDVKEDLARRDFTINAMAYSAEEGLIDPFGGRADLAAGIVRAVGEPERRFEEDALRILRLYRFAARFGFALDPATGEAAKALSRHLDCVSAERIAEELSRLLAAPKPGTYLEPAVLAVLFPELNLELLPEICRIIDALTPGMEHFPVRLAALLCPLGEAGARAPLKRLKVSNALAENVTVLVRGCPKFFRRPSGGWDPVAEGNRAGNGMARFVSEEEASDTPAEESVQIQTKRLLERYDLHTVEQMDALCGAICPEKAADFAAQAALARQLEAESVCCRVNQLAVNGRDLMAAGVAPGPGLRRVLEGLLEQVITGRLPNEKTALLAAAAQFSAS